MVKVPSGARCLGCQYALEWLEAPRCPECGRGFDPADSATFWLPGQWAARVRRYVPGWVVWSFEAPLNANDRAMAGWLACAAVGSSLWQVSIPLGVLGLAVAAGLTGATLGDLGKMPKAARGRVARRFAAAALVAAVLNVGVEQCPHATYVSLWGVPVPVAGRPCGNPRHASGVLNLVSGIESPW